MKMSKMVGVITVSAVLLGLTSIARADNMDADEHSNVACPVGLVSGLTLTDEFGAEVAANTRCIKKRHNVKTMFAIGQLYAFNTNASGAVVASGPYALNQIKNVISDYEITDGMTQGQDYQIIAVVHGPGGKMLLNNSGPAAKNTCADPTNPSTCANPFKAQVEALMAKGVTFYFCENTVRGLMGAGFITKGNAAADVIPGVKFVTAGLSAMSDFEALGWSYVAP
jgi:intracellular sulfur oxidation DsrE/DsrF family protein